MNKIAVSVLNCDFGNLNSEVEMINGSAAECFHLDIMDGVFVPNISFGFPVIQAIKAKASKPLDVHLMISDADRYIAAFAKAGAHWLTVHYEASTHLHRTVQTIRHEGMKAGIALNPHTPVSVLEDIIDNVDMVLLMSVNPGFGGQSFIENTYAKTARLKAMIEQHHARALIEVDGGVDASNIDALAKAGVDMFVVGSFIFRAEQPAAVIEQLAHSSSILC